ncbi:MAG: FkbM family methyltransferase [Opitutaceae bacterium]
MKHFLRPFALPVRDLRHCIFARTSYAADSEDIAAALLLGRVDRFIDVGANDGFSGSNTLRFALRGARGLCFEPDPINFERLTAYYRLNSRVTCVAEGLSDAPGTVSMRCDGMLSQFEGVADPGLERLLKRYRRPDASSIFARVSTLGQWLQQRPAFACSDLLSIDVEGHELSVLRGIDWARTPKPARCVVVETHADGAADSWRHKNYDEIASLLDVRGYSIIAASANNTIWLHENDVEESRIAAGKSRLPHYRWLVA